MKKIIVAAIGVSVAAGLAWFGMNLGDKSDVALNSTLDTSQVEISNVQVGVKLPSVDAESQMPLLIADPDTEIVMGIEVRKDRNCTVQRHYIQSEDGTAKEAYSCVPNETPDVHPYWDYDNEALLSLSYGDASAAEILAVRRSESNKEEAMDLMIRSAALSDDPRPLFWLAQNSYSDITIEQMKIRYVLISVAENMGHDSADASYWREKLIEFNVNERDIDSLDARVADVIETMQRIRQEVGEAVQNKENGNA